MRPVRAIVYGVGAMGSIMARLMLDKGVEIVGAVGRSPEKVGRDLGEVAGLGRPTGVTSRPTHAAPSRRVWTSRSSR